MSSSYLKLDFDHLLAIKTYLKNPYADLTWSMCSFYPFFCWPHLVTISCLQTSHGHINLCVFCHSLTSPGHEQLLPAVHLLFLSLTNLAWCPGHEQLLPEVHLLFVQHGTSLPRSLQSAHSVYFSFTLPPSHPSCLTSVVILFSTFVLVYAHFSILYLPKYNDQHPHVHSSMHGDQFLCYTECTSSIRLIWTYKTAYC